MNSIIGKLVWHLQYYDIFNVLMDKKENGDITTNILKYSIFLLLYSQNETFGCIAKVWSS